MQRAVSHADRDLNNVFCRQFRRPRRIAALRAAAYRFGAAGRGDDIFGVPPALRHGAARRALVLYAGAAALPQAAAGQGAGALGAGPHALCIGPCSGGCGAGGRAAVVYGKSCRWRTHAFGRLRVGAGSGRALFWAGRRDPAGVCAGLSRKRDRCADHHYGVSFSGQSGGDERSVPAAGPFGAKRMDVGDGGMHHAVFTDALALLHNVFDDPQRDAELEMDSGGGFAAHGRGIDGLCAGGKSGPRIRGRIKNNLMVFFSFRAFGTAEQGRQTLKKALLQCTNLQRIKCKNRRI